MVDVLEDQSDCPNQGEDERSERDGSEVVSEGPPVSSRHSALSFICRVAVCVLIEVPDAAGRADDEVAEREDEGDDPEDSEEVEVPHSPGVVVPDDLSERQVISGFHFADREEVDGSDDPYRRETAREESVDDGNQQDRQSLRHELARGLDERRLP